MNFDELRRIQEQFAAPIAAAIKMHHAGYELLRDEIPVAAPTPFPHSSFAGLRIIIDNDIPPDRMVVIDQHGHLLDVIMLVSSPARE